MIPGLRIGRYEVGERLGKGGFGVVHLARDTELGRDIAIKFLKAEFSSREQIVQRFLREARAAATIGHPGIVIVFECGVVSGTGRADGTAYIAMERLVGESLGERLQSKRVFPLTTTIAIGRQLAQALQAAHTAGIIHRDLKPDNVFLIRDAAVVGGERCKILDFGIAKLADPGPGGVHTHSQMILGTPRYMSPEQARSAAKVDARSDIYSLGCMLYEMICGRTPFDGFTGDVLLKHQSAEVVPLRELMENVPEALDRLVMRMLEKDPDARPPSMQAVDDALATIVAAPNLPAVPVLIPKARPASRDSDSIVAPPPPPPPLPRADGDELTIPRPLVGARDVAGMIARGTIDVTQVEDTLATPPPRRQLFGLVVIGVAALVGVAIVIAIAARTGSPELVHTEVHAPPPADAVVPVDAAREIDAAREPVIVATPDHPRPAIAILGIEVLSTTINADAARVARDLTVDLRTLARADSRYNVATGSDRELVDEKLLQNCADEDPSCMAQIGMTFHAAVLIYGKLERKPLGKQAGYQISLRLLDVTTRTLRPGWTDWFPLDEATTDGLERVARRGYDRLHEPCNDPDAVARVEARVEQQLVTGQWESSLATIEEILACKPALANKAFLAACRGKRFEKAYVYFKSVPATMAQICLKEGYDPRTNTMVATGRPP